MNSNTYERVALILEKNFRADLTQCQPLTTLVDLNLDSLALMEFVFAVEDEFGVRIPEDRLDPREAGITLQRLCDVIDGLVKS